MIKKKTEKKVKKKPEGYVFGAPTKYRKEYCRQIVEWFDMPLTNKKGQANDVPTFVRFALKISVSVETLHEWRNKHPNFSEAYSIAQALRENFIMQNALHNRYNAGFAWRVMQNQHNWKSADQIEQKEIKMPPLKIELVNNAIPTK